MATYKFLFVLKMMTLSATVNLTISAPTVLFLLSRVRCSLASQLLQIDFNMRVLVKHFGNVYQVAFFVHIHHAFIRM